ncbi:radical SAM family heme chaperone HemW [Sphingomonas sp. RB56-2]|uniref:Heme chaperone HemW n=1 Tax=Sphingomonas brevis TaxID=2908206 RepID=A0ABT0S901_9SPHN|nr:radical SAM family heme chaperone HemW [Sphingomonas brevis]MCL6740624.1 radical SAM family heme chaperone HemW [Sphingomonas brevis]
MATIAIQPEPALPELPTAVPLALYVHWPFCVSKCPYCDFNSHVRASIDQEEWRDALLADLAHEAALLPDHRLSSIFFGGGTPSLMEPTTVEAIIASARDFWPQADDLEITLEANPNSAEAARFAELAMAGVNRISLGLQSFDDRSLAFLGRAHSADEGLRALDAAQSAVDRVSFDLIYALPGDTEADWSDTLGRALGLGTEHLSLYQLTIEPGTRFASMVAKHEFEPLNAEAAATLFEITQERSAAAGLPAYEISNHARPGCESRHNVAYWRYQDYAGVGPGAHGRRMGMCTVRHKKPENFLSAVARNGNGLVEEEVLTRHEAAYEALVMGLRLGEGIAPAQLAERIGVDRIVDDDAVARLSSLGLLEHGNGRVRTTQAGRLLLDSILAEIAA